MKKKAKKRKPKPKWNPRVGFGFSRIEIDMARHPPRWLFIRQD